MHSAIRFSGSSSRSMSSSMEVASAAAEPPLSVSSIPRRRSADQDDALSLLEPAARLPTSTTSKVSALSQRSLRSGSHPSAAVDGDDPGAAPTASSSYTCKGDNADALLHQPPGNPQTRVPSSFAATVDTRASEASIHSARGRSGSSRRDNLGPVAPQSRAATQPPHTHPGRVFANLPWIPPPPIYGTPLPDSSNMNRHYAHYYDPTEATLRAPFCYPDDVPLRAQGHHSDVSGTEWPKPSDLPLPSTFPMPPHVLPQLSLPVVSASAAEAAARGMVAAPHVWAIPPPLLYPPPPPPPWWFYGTPPLPLPASSSDTSASSAGSSRHASSSSRASARPTTQPSRHPPANAARPHAEAAAPSRHGVAVPAGSVETPVAVASRGDAGGSHAAKQRSVASSGSRYAAGHTVGTGRAARRSVGSFSASGATSPRSATTTTAHSDPPQGVERRVYASSGSGSSDIQRCAKGQTVQVAPRRTNAAHCVQPDQLQVYGEDVVQERDCSSVTARMKRAVSAAEAYVEKMEHLYRRLRSRYEEVVMSPGKVARYGGNITADEGAEEKRHRRTAPPATTRATRAPPEKGLLHPLERAFSRQTHLQPTAPMPHAKRPVSPALSAAHSSAVEPSPPLSSSSSATSATSLRRELHLLESQWQRLEELKRHGSGGTAAAVAQPAAPSPSTATATVNEDPFTNRRFLQLIKDRKHLLMSAA
ncbi:hypothetical protein conserved [Leishmania donovani]|nr:hypothetical protein conserved [Leishmania donovani]